MDTGHDHGQAHAHGHAHGHGGEHAATNFEAKGNMFAEAQWQTEKMWMTEWFQAWSHEQVRSCGLRSRALVCPAGGRARPRPPLYIWACCTFPCACC